jgi:uncharacterized phage infection (PIP) family protein YhgE
MTSSSEPAGQAGQNEPPTQSSAEQTEQAASSLAAAADKAASTISAAADKAASTLTSGAEKAASSLAAGAEKAVSSMRRGNGVYELPVVHARIPAPLVNAGFWAGLAGSAALGVVEPPLALLVGAGVVVARHTRRR